MKPLRALESVESLFAPFTLKSLRLANRIVMAPMRGMASVDGVLVPTHSDY